MVLNLLLGAPAAFVYARYVFPGQEAHLHVPDPQPAGAGGRAGHADLHDAAGARAGRHAGSASSWCTRPRRCPSPCSSCRCSSARCRHEIFEAAVLDHCSRFQTFLRIALPLALPSIGATGLFAFMLSYSEYMFSMVLSGDAATPPGLGGDGGAGAQHRRLLEPAQHGDLHRDRADAGAGRRWSGASWSRACSAARSRDRIMADSDTGHPLKTRPAGRQAARHRRALFAGARGRRRRGWS